MSIWYCKNHGLTGPMACCGDAERAEIKMSNCTDDPVDIDHRSLVAARNEMRAAIAKYLSAAENWGSVHEDVCDDIREAIDSSGVEKYEQDICVKEIESK